MGLSSRTNDLYLHKALLLLLLESAAAKLAQMKGALTANRGFKPHAGFSISLSVSFVLIAVIPNKLDAQSMGMASKNVPNPPSASTSGPVTNILRDPDGWAITAGPPTAVPHVAKKRAKKEKAVKEKAVEEEPCQCPPPTAPPRQPQTENKSAFLTWLGEWTFDLSTLYQFSNERSRVGQFSWDINSVGISFTTSFNLRPYTSLGASYVYSHWNGWSPTGQNDVANQHIGSVRILQPLNNIWSCEWKPADQSDIPINHQLAILVGTAYGGSLGRLTTPNFALQHETIYSLIGDAFLDYQFAWFPRRCVPESLRQEHLSEPQQVKLFQYRDSSTYNYPNLVFEFTSGPQFGTARIDSSGSGSPTTTSGRQFDYVNSAILTGSLPCRWGFLVGVTLNSPFDSQPVRGGRPDRANTATFTGGVVFNLFPSTDPGLFHHPSWQRFSLSLLYSYTAFDPLTETNAIQVQASYAF